MRIGKYTLELAFYLNGVTGRGYCPTLSVWFDWPGKGYYYARWNYRDGLLVDSFWPPVRAKKLPC